MERRPERRPTQVDEQRLPFINYPPWKHRTPLCHLDRSVAQWRDLRFSGAILEMFFRQSGVEGANVRASPSACKNLR